MKKLGALTITLCLLISCLYGCGKQAAALSSTDTKEPIAVTENDEDMAEVNMVYFSMGPIPSGLSDVENALNNITEKEINVHVNIEMIETGNYAQQIGLKASSGEKMDLLLTPPIEAASFNSMAAQNQLMDMTDLLNEHGQGILDTIGNLIASTTKSGKILGVPCYRSLVTSMYIVMRTDVLEDLGLLEKAQNMSSLTEYEDILKAVKESEKWNNLAGIVSSDGQGTCLAVTGAYAGTDAFKDAGTYDALGDPYKIISINPDGSSNTVLSNLETDDYKAMWLQMKQWYEKGYVYKDVTTNHELAEQLIKSNVGFSYFSLSEIGIETAKSTACAMPVTCVKVLTLPIDTFNCTKFTWAIPTSATELVAATKLLNLMYTSRDVANLLAWGVEDIHYQIKDGVAYYPEGVDAASCTYHTADFLYGNQFNVLPWEGQSADFRKLAQKETQEGLYSAYLGFSCNTNAIQSELAAVSNVMAEYHPSIDSGIASEEDYEAFLQKMKASGLQIIIDEYQKQLNAWLQTNK